MSFSSRSAVLGRNPSWKGVTIADTVQLAKELQGYVDLIQIRGTFIDASQATYLDLRRFPHHDVTAQIAQAVHDAGIETKIVLVGGATTQTSWMTSSLAGMLT